MKEFTIGILNGIIFAAISAFIVQIWFQDNNFHYNFYFNDFNYDYCWIIWYFSSCNIKKNEY